LLGHRRGPSPGPSRDSVFFLDDLVTEIDALVADVHAGAGDQLLDLPVALPTERALEQRGRPRSRSPQDCAQADECNQHHSAGDRPQSDLVPQHHDAEREQSDAREHDPSAVLIERMLRPVEAR
jgi:hypothetical protein